VEDFWFIVAERSEDEAEIRVRKAPAEQVLKDIRRQTRRQYSAEEKIRMVLEGLRGEENISELCRPKASPPRCITAGPRSSWRPANADWQATRHAPQPPAKLKTFAVRRPALKEVVADLTLENRLLKKSMNGDGEDEA
jgi:transposase